jgi:hypothetical protein
VVIRRVNALKPGKGGARVEVNQTAGKTSNSHFGGKGTQMGRMKQIHTDMKDTKSA